MRTGERLLSPRVVFPVLAVIILLLLITTPRDQERQTAHLTTYSVHPFGGLGLARTAERVGWSVERRLIPARERLDAARVYVLLAPPVPVTSVETSRLLAAVREGAGLLYVMGSTSTPLTDSLRLRQSRRSFRALPLVDPMPAEQHGISARARGALANEVHHAIEVRGPLPPDTVLFASVWAPRSGRFETPSILPAGVTEDSIIRPAVLGIPYGRGRIAVIADPNLLTNTALRTGETAIMYVRVLEWLAPGKAPLVFSEFHQGFGRQPSTTRAVQSLLLGTPAGRVIVALSVAVAILMLAASVRPLAPLPTDRVERRSALEHVDALASAYERIEGTRAATQRLVRGLKRRHVAPATRARGDDEYLAALASRHPALGSPVSRVRRALHTRVTADEFAEVGAALNTIERTITT